MEGGLGWEMEQGRGRRGRYPRIHEEGRRANEKIKGIGGLVLVKCERGERKGRTCLFLTGPQKMHTLNA